MQDYKRERWDLFPLADFAFYANSDFASDSLASQSEDFEVLGKTYLTNFKLKLYLCRQKGFFLKYILVIFFLYSGIAKNYDHLYQYFLCVSCRSIKNNTSTFQCILLLQLGHVWNVTYRAKKTKVTRFSFSIRQLVWGHSI